MNLVLWVGAALVAGGLLSYLGQQFLALRKRQETEKKAEEVLVRTRDREKEILLEAKEEALKLRAQA